MHHNAVMDVDAFALQRGSDVEGCSRAFVLDSREQGPQLMSISITIRLIS